MSKRCRHHSPQDHKTVHRAFKMTIIPSYTLSLASLNIWRISEILQTKALHISSSTLSYVKIVAIMTGSRRAYRAGHFNGQTNHQGSGSDVSGGITWKIYKKQVSYIAHSLDVPRLTSSPSSVFLTNCKARGSHKSRSSLLPFRLPIS